MRISQTKIKEIKDAYLLHQQIDTSPIRPEVLESWIRSMRMGLPREGDCLLDSTRDSNTRGNILQRTIVLSKLLKKTWEQATDLLAEIGGAVFFLDQNLSAYVRGGDPILLEELAQKNIKFSTNFQERTIGTNAASLSMTLGKPTWLIGEEHYAECLRGYCCYANIIRESSGSGLFSITDNSASSTLCFLPLEKATRLNKKIIESLFSMKYQLNYIQNSAEQWTKELRLNHSGAVLITNIEGLITCINQAYCDMVSSCPNDLLGYSAEEKCPQLYPYIETAIKGNRSLNISVLLGKRKQEYYINSYPVIKDGQTIGSATNFTSAEMIKKGINRHIAYNARFTFDDIVGESTALKHVKQLAKLVANSASTILITGESGTGKEMFAQAIHNNSSRKSNPFIAINCAAIPQELIGSELFGYAEGAFTGAKRGGAMGKFELANNGTIFLDEISEMPLDMQSVLLRVLEERVVNRIGESLSRPINVRVIAASNRNILKYVEDKKFRLDLYYRLNVIHLDIPPLRERNGDIPILFEQLRRKIMLTSNGGFTGVSPEAMKLLQEYHWPGNVRELRNVVERCVNIVNDREILAEDLPHEIYDKYLTKPQAVSNTSVQLPASFDSYQEYERAMLAELMKKHNGNKSAVADEMRISRGKLYRLLEKYGDLKF